MSSNKETSGSQDPMASISQSNEASLEATQEQQILAVASSQQQAASPPRPAIMPVQLAASSHHATKSSPAFNYGRYTDNFELLKEQKKIAAAQEEIRKRRASETSHAHPVGATPPKKKLKTGSPVLKQENKKPSLEEAKDKENLGRASTRETAFGGDGHGSPRPSPRWADYEDEEEDEESSGVFEDTLVASDGDDTSTVRGAEDGQQPLLTRRPPHLTADGLLLKKAVIGSNVSPLVPAIPSTDENPDGYRLYPPGYSVTLANKIESAEKKKAEKEGRIYVAPTWAQRLAVNAEEKREQKEWERRVQGRDHDEDLFNAFGRQIDPLGPEAERTFSQNEEHVRRRLEFNIAKAKAESQRKAILKQQQQEMAAELAAKQKRDDDEKKMRDLEAAKERWEEESMVPKRQRKLTLVSKKLGGDVDESYAAKARRNTIHDTCHPDSHLA